jgi:trehalose 2-sulfotransferase
VLDCVNPPPLIIRLERRDKIRQAISYARAAKSDVWRISHVAYNPPCNLDASDLPMVNNWVTKFEAWQAAWDALFAALALSPVCLYYEDLVQDWGRGLDQVARNLGIVLPQLQLSQVTISTARQSDAATEKFLKAFYKWKSASTRTRRPSQISLGK